MNAPPEFVKKLRESLGVFRLTRASIFNFSILGILFVTGINTSIGILFFVLAIICYSQSKYNALHYYKRVFQYYEEDDKGEESDD